MAQSSVLCLLPFPLKPALEFDRPYCFVTANPIEENP